MIAWRKSGLALAATLAIATPAQAREPDRRELARLVAAVDAIDNSADPAGYLKAAEAALAEAQRLYPAPHPEVAARQVAVATGLASASRFDDALTVAEPAAATLAAAGPAWRRHWLEGLATLGYLYTFKSEHPKALDAFTREVEGRRALGARDDKLAVALSNLGAAKWEAESRDEALALNAEAIALGESLPEPPGDLVIWYANRSVYLFTAGRTDDAIAIARTGLARGDAILPPGHPLLANLLANLGAMLTRQGRPADAAPIVRRAFELVEKAAGKPTQNSAAMRVMFAQALIEQGAYAQAEAFLEGAIPIIEGELGRDSDRALLARETRAMALIRLGRAAEARAIETQVVAVRDARLPATHRDRMNGRVNLAKIALAENDLAAARAALDAAVALRIRAVPANHPDLLAERAMLLMVTVRAEPARAGALAADARAILAALIENAGFERGGVSTNRDRAAFGYIAEVLLAAGDVEGAFIAQQWSARTSVDDAVAAAAAQRAAAADPALAERLAARRQLAVQRAQLFAAVQAELQRPDPAFRLDEASARIAAVDAQLRAADTAGTLAFAARPLAATQSTLAPRDVFAMVTDLGGDRTAVTVLTRTRAAQYLVDGSTAALRSRVAHLRATLDGSGEGAFDLAAAHALHAALFPKSGAALVTRADRLLVAANGALASLPFGVLSPDGRAHLIDRLAVERLPGAPRGGDRREAVAARALVGIGNVSAGRAATGAIAMRSAADARILADLPALPESARELADLARAAGAANPVLLTGADATEARFRATPVAAGAVVAFATHGLVSGELEGLREPALVLTPADADDGLLTASEISALTLPAEWVVLSACNTAAGAGPDAPGLSGLAQAFILAGAERMLATHWRVRDDVARAISVGTLTAAARGLPPAAALRDAILSVRRGPLPGAASPAMWGVFELIGQ